MEETLPTPARSQTTPTEIQVHYTGLITNNAGGTINNAFGTIYEQSGGSITNNPKASIIKMRVASPTTRKAAAALAFQTSATTALSPTRKS